MHTTFLSALISLPLFVLIGFAMLAAELVWSYVEERLAERTERLKEQRR